MTHLLSRISTVPAVLTLAAIVAFIGLWGLDAPRAEANHEGGMNAMSIDTNTAGNDADTIGPNNTCVSVTAGGTFVVDVTADDIPFGHNMIAFGFTLNYDANFFTVTAADHAMLLGALQGSSVLVATIPPPDSDGTYTASAADTSFAAHEIGDGVIERVTLSVDGGTPAGEYALTLSGAAHVDGGHGGAPTGHAPDALRDATVMVDEPCPTPPTGAGDVDCDQTVNSIDSLKILRHGASLSVPQNEPCPDLNTDSGNGGRLQGDVDCNETVNSVDALKVLRAVASLFVPQEPDCPPVI
jgi:hypothetical protein